MPDSHGLAAHQVLTCIYIFMKHHRQLFAYNANCNIHVLALFKREDKEDHHPPLLTCSVVVLRGENQHGRCLAVVSLEPEPTDE